MNGSSLTTFDASKPADAVQGIYEEVVSALLAGQRGIAVLTAEPTDAAVLLRAIPSSKRLAKVRFLRFTPPAPLQITLESVAFQAGLDLPHGGDVSAAALFDTLRAHLPSSGCTVLIVEGAESLTPEALGFFEHVATPSLSPQLMQLVLIGRGFYGILSKMEHLPHLRSIAQEALSIPCAGPSEAPPPIAAAAAADGDDVAPLLPYAAAQPRGRVSGKVMLAVSVAVLAGGVALYATPWFDPAPASKPHPNTPDPPLKSSPPVQAAQHGAAQAVVPVLSAPPAEPPQQPETPAVLAVPPQPASGDITRQQLRQRFDAFLDEAGNDTALLTQEQRDALFEKYLTSHGSVSPAP